MTRSIGWALLVLILFSTAAMAADQTVVGTGNDRAIAIAEKSPLIKSAMAFLRQEAGRIRDSKLRRETLDAFTDPSTCVAHRANLSDKDKAAIIQRLIDAALVNPDDAAGFPGGLTAGIFPPLKDDGTACPHLPQHFDSAPGSVFAGHHSYPGGLAVHEAFNDISDLSLAADYRMAYGHVDRAGLPSINIAGLAGFTQPDEGLDIDQDLIIAAPIWHDWAKTFVFQWNADGTEFRELNFGGNGKTDGYDGKGDSRTPAHHMLGLAESIKRGLSPEFVIAQASAHSAPTVGNEFKVVNWIRAAAIIARVDPVANGYLATDANGKLHLPALAATGSFDFATVAPSAPYFLPEDTLNNLSDGNYFLAVPAAYQMGLVLAKLAPEFGFNPADAASFNNEFRNPVFSYLSAERLLFIYTRHGVEGVRGEIKRLRQLGVI